MKDGLIIGMQYGKKFIIEDIQNHRFTEEDLLNMSEEELNDYCREIREEI